jgi:hypothetical protein
LTKRSKILAIKTEKKRIRLMVLEILGYYKFCSGMSKCRNVRTRKINLKLPPAVEAIRPGAIWCINFPFPSFPIKRERRIFYPIGLNRNPQTINLTSNFDDCLVRMI